MPLGRISCEHLKFFVNRVVSEGGYSVSALQEPDKGTRIGYIVVEHERKVGSIVVERTSEPIVVIRDRNPNRQVLLIFPSVLREMIEPLLEKES
ncbi:MAG: hypothetical protein FJ044_00375 [Candidatus Cloacimonetes bacterium]|nr:hypothetical protein [Candidatus Cloacimonadota bacterium]